MMTRAVAATMGALVSIGCAVEFDDESSLQTKVQDYSVSSSGLLYKMERTNYEEFDLWDGIKNVPTCAWWSPHGLQETILTKLAEPPVANVKRIAFVTTGEQNHKGLPNALTGQPDKWRQEWECEQGSMWVTVNKPSVVHELIRGGYFNPAESFVAAAWDPGFDYLADVATKNRIEDAYFEWLTSKVESENLKEVFLVGMSRGGCLAMRLARRFIDEFPQVKVIVQSIDGVCNEGQDELELTKNRVTNPLNGEYFSFSVDMNDVYPDGQDRLAIHQLTSGSPAVGGIDFAVSARSFVHENAEGSDGVPDFFAQEWVNREHGEFREGAFVREQVIWQLLRGRVKVGYPEKGELIRLQHVNSDRCLYSSGGNGGATKQWNCWNDPEMNYVLDKVEGGYRVRHALTNQCLIGNSEDGGVVKHWSCWNSPTMLYKKVDMGNGTFRLANERYGKCLYNSSGGNGGEVKNWSCWDDPNMRYVAVPVD